MFDFILCVTFVSLQCQVNKPIHTRHQMSSFVLHPNDISSTSNIRVWGNRVLNNVTRTWSNHHRNVTIATYRLTAQWCVFFASSFCAHLEPVTSDLTQRRWMTLVGHQIQTKYRLKKILASTVAAKRIYGCPEESSGKGFKRSKVVVIS